MTSSSWANRSVNETEAVALRKLLGSEAGHRAEDEIGARDLSSYVNRGKSIGLTDPTTLVYYCDLVNQWPVQADKIAAETVNTYGTAATVDKIHEIAKDSPMAGILRTRAYNYCINIKWDGYGFSDVVDGDRDFDTLLRQDREALKKAGIEAPYVLCPHSMSGIEAILWAQKYPDEVEAIVGLDMSTPKAYTEENLNDDDKGMELFYKFLRESGVGRLILTDKNVCQSFSDREKDIYKALAFRKFANKDVADEGDHLADAIDEINSADKPDIPTLLFLSDGKETSGKLWIDAMNDYSDGLTDSRVIQLDCGHNVAEHEPEKIEEEMRKFIAELDS
jgi:pimeloyl-ACP methyl ester carboxylesterase